jgi:hypothetical protein
LESWRIRPESGRANGGGGQYAVVVGKFWDYANNDPPLRASGCEDPLMISSRSKRRWPFVMTGIALAVELLVVVALVLSPGIVQPCGNVFGKWFCQSVMTHAAGPIGLALSGGPPTALALSILGLMGRGKRWHADPITPVVVFWVAVVMTSIDVGLHVLWLLMSMADWH